MKTAILLVAVVGLLCACAPQTSAAKVPPGPIKHFIVLMMENRAFDHMLGWMSEKNPEIVGLNGTQSNPWDYEKPQGRRIFANKGAKDVRCCITHIDACITSLCGRMNAREPLKPLLTLRIGHLNLQVAPDFSHSINGTGIQIYGTPTPGFWNTPDMQGFIKSAREHVRPRIAS